MGKVNNKNVKEIMSISEIEEMFANEVEEFGDLGYFDIADFEVYRKYITNWSVLEECIKGEDEGEDVCDLWDSIKFVG